MLDQSGVRPGVLLLIDSENGSPEKILISLGNLNCNVRLVVARPDVVVWRDVELPGADDRSRVNLAVETDHREQEPVEVLDQRPVQ